MPDKYLARDVTGPGYKEVEGTVGTGAVGDAGKILALDTTGHIDPRTLPSGVGAETVTAVALVALTAGDYVTTAVGTGVNAGSVVATQASAAATTGTASNGFVKTAAAVGATVTVYFGGMNDALTGLVAGKSYWLSDTQSGKGTPTRVPASTTAASQAGKIDQLLGIAMTATALDYRYSLPTTVA